MAYVDNFESLFKKTDDLTPEKIILKFFDAKDNLALKTEIPDKALMALVALSAYAKRLRAIGLVKTADLAEALVDFFLQYMVSRDRQGRGEGERMLGALREQLQQKGVISKLLGAE